MSTQNGNDHLPYSPPAQIRVIGVLRADCKITSSKKYPSSYKWAFISGKSKFASLAKNLVREYKHELHQRPSHLSVTKKHGNVLSDLTNVTVNIETWWIIENLHPRVLFLQAQCNVDGERSSHHRKTQKPCNFRIGDIVTKTPGNRALSVRTLMHTQKNKIISIGVADHIKQKINVYTSLKIWGDPHQIKSKRKSRITHTQTILKR
jgi:hypothetical protein